MNRFFIYDLIKKIKDNPTEVILNGSGNQFRDYLHVDDIVKGLKIINSKGKPGEIYNLCSGKKTELKSLANDIKEILKLEKTIISWDKNSYKGIRDSWYGDNSKIKKIGFISQDSEKSLKKPLNTFFKDLSFFKITNIVKKYLLKKGIFLKDNPSQKKLIKKDTLNLLSIK